MAQTHSPAQWFTATRKDSVGTGTASSVLITAPATGSVYLHAEISAKKAGELTFSTAPNASGGTTVTSYSMDRSSSSTASTTITHTATWLSSGTVLENHIFGGIESERFIGGTRNLEWKLNASTLYLLYFTADGATTEWATNIRFAEV